MLKTGQQLTSSAKSQRLLASLKFKEALLLDPQFHRNIIFTDESHIDINGYLNKQIDRQWGTKERIPIRIEKVAHPLRVTLWCGIHFKYGILGPYFFEEEHANGKVVPVIVNTERYIDMIDNFLMPLLNERMVRDPPSSSVI